MGSVSKMSVSVRMSVVIVVRCYSSSVSSGLILSKEVSFSSCYLRCILNWFRSLGKRATHKGNKDDLK